VAVPHPVPVPVPQPVGVPVPKPYPVPVPHPVPVPSAFLVGASGGGVPFGGLGDFFSLGRGAGSYGGGVFIPPSEGHGLTTGYGFGWPASDLSHVHQIPLRLPGFEPSSSAYGIYGHAPTAAYSGQGQHQPPSVDAVVANDPADSFSYVQDDKGAPPTPTGVVPTPTSPVVPTVPEDGYRHGPGFKV
jgi:hypothetical protein